MGQGFDPNVKAMLEEIDKKASNLVIYRHDVFRDGGTQIFCGLLFGSLYVYFYLGVDNKYYWDGRPGECEPVTNDETSLILSKAISNYKNK